MEAVWSQQTKIRQAAQKFAQTILAGRMVHVFGSGYSRILGEEMCLAPGHFQGAIPSLNYRLPFKPGGWRRFGGLPGRPDRCPGKLIK